MNTNRFAGQIVAFSFFLFSLTMLCNAQAAETETPNAAQPKQDLNLKTGLEVGNRAPLFSGKGLEQETIDLKAEAAKADYVLLDFWASWCGPCRAEFPHLRRLNERYGNRGLKIIGVCSDTDRDTASRAAKGAKLDYAHVYHADGGLSVTDLYQVTGIPQTYLLDSNLKIIAKGLRGTSLERRIEQLFVTTELTALKPNDTIVVTAESAKLKVVNDVVATLSKGQKLSVLQKQGNWIWTSVNRDGKQIKGWVEGSRIALSDTPLQPNADTNAVPMEAPAKLKEMTKPAKDNKEVNAKPNIAVVNQAVKQPAKPGTEATPTPAKIEEIEVAAAVELPSPPPPAKPEPADWELAGKQEIPQLFEFANAAGNQFDLAGEGIGEVRRFELTGTDFSAAAISSDGRFVVSGGDDTLIRLWEAESGREVRQFTGRKIAIKALAFSNDGRRVLSGGADGAVCLWETATGTEVVRFTGHESEVTSVAFVSGGRFATSTGADKTLRMWRLPVDKTPSKLNKPETQVADRAEPKENPQEKQPAEILTKAETEPKTTTQVEVKTVSAVAEKPSTLLTALGGDAKVNSASHIVSIDFREKPIGDAGLSRLKNLQHLETLYLRGRDISDVGLLESIAGMKHLKHLWLTDTNITDAGLKTIENLTLLESLVLSHCHAVTDGGLAHLKGLKNITDLWLDGTQITDKGLADVGKLTQLKTLVLPGNSTITDAGLKHLQGLSGIQDLWLNGANISDSGLVHLQQLTSLKYVDAGETQITVAGTQHLKAALPNCEIER